MKMTKKLLVAAVAAITVLGFTGCDLLAGKKSLSDAFQHQAGEKDLLKFSDQSDLSVWTIEGENSSDTDYVRSIQFLQTKHTDMAGLVKLDLEPSVEGYSAAGVIGVLFDASRAKDDDGNFRYNFGIAAIGKGKNTYYYVSYFANVKEEDLPKSNFGVSKVKTAVDPEEKEPYEIRYTGTAASEGLVYFTKAQIEKITDTTDDASMLKAVIDVDEQEDGSYLVMFYGKETIGKNDYFDAGTNLPIATIAMTASSLGKTEAKQAQCGAYAMVNKQSTLNGSLTILDLTNDAIVVEE